MKLNQVIALVQGKKARASKLLTSIHQGWKKDRLNGISRNYSPKDEDGDQFPPEHRIVQVRVRDEIQKVRDELADFYNIVATQEKGNTTAKADIKIGNDTILMEVPVTVLLFLEKQLIDLRTFAQQLPPLSTDRSWQFDQAKNCWVTDPETTVKTQKTVEPIVKYHATPEHPAQTDLISVDKVIGHWNTIHMSGAMPESEKAAIVERVEKLLESVKMAREKANDTEVKPVAQVGEKILDYIFKS